MMTILTLQQYYNEILILQQHSVYNVSNRHCKVPAIFQKPATLATFLKYIYINIFLKYSLTITVLCRICHANLKMYTSNKKLDSIRILDLQKKIHPY